jgi:hypothetical protein
LADRVSGVADPPELPLMTEEDVRAGQRDDPPFGPHHHGTACETTIRSTCARTRSAARP